MTLLTTIEVRGQGNAGRGTPQMADMLFQNDCLRMKAC